DRGLSRRRRQARQRRRLQGRAGGRRRARQDEQSGLREPPRRAAADRELHGRRRWEGASERRGEPEAASLVRHVQHGERRRSEGDGVPRDQVRHGAAAAAAAAAAALLAGCGGSGSGSLPEGAGKTPADAPAFVSLKTDPGSAQWKRALSLARRFPGLRAQLDRLDRYKDAVGPELDVVWLDFANNRDDVVALTKPRNLAQLKTLAQPDPASYSAPSDGW